MSTEEKDIRPNFLLSLLSSKCTLCRRGDMFVHHNPYHLSKFMKMHDECPVCGQPMDLEPGFYYGTNMISYGLAIFICIISFFLWWVLIGFSYNDNRFFWWIGVNAFLLIALQPPLMRISRTVWLAFFVKYSRNWAQGDIIERYSVNKEHQNNW